MKCPICENIVYADDTLDTEYCKSKYYDTVKGTCPNCGRSWLWVEVFTFDHIENISEINDHL